MVFLGLVIGGGGLANVLWYTIFNDYRFVLGICFCLPSLLVFLSMLFYAY